MIAGLWNTGVDENGIPQGPGFQEFHYDTLLPVDADSAYLVRTVQLPGSYVANPPDAAWIGPTLSPNEGALINDPVGEYIYAISFDLTGFDPSSTLLSARWASDNHSSIWLNGIPTGFETGFAAFGSLTDFTLKDGMLNPFGTPLSFLPSLNTLEFKVVNGSGSGNPSALLVSELSGEATPMLSGLTDDATSVPDGGITWLLLAAGFACWLPIAGALAKK